MAYGLLPLLLDQEYIENNISNSHQRIDLPVLYQAELLENRFLFKTPDFGSNGKSCDDNYERWNNNDDEPAACAAAAGGLEDDSDNFFLIVNPLVEREETLGSLERLESLEMDDAQIEA